MDSKTSLYKSAPKSQNLELQQNELSLFIHPIMALGTLSYFWIMVFIKIKPALVLFFLNITL